MQEGGNKKRCRLVLGMGYNTKRSSAPPPIYYSDFKPAHSCHPPSVEFHPDLSNPWKLNILLFISAPAFVKLRELQIDAVVWLTFARKEAGHSQFRVAMEEPRACGYTPTHERHQETGT